MKPSTYSVTRSADIAATPQSLRVLVNDFHNWKEWSPWEQLDPNMSTSYSGAPLGAGSVYEWSGNRKAGQGRMEMLGHVGADVWVLPCPRALDHTPPGDWTLAFRREESGPVTGVTVGCWLARRLSYARIG